MIEIELKGDIGFEITLANVMGAVKLHEGKEINFIVTSYGGFVDEAERIYKYLQPISNVWITYKEVCASAATFAFLSISKERRKAYENTMFAIHLPYKDVLFEQKTAPELENDAQILNETTEKIISLYEKHLNLTRKEIETLLNPESIFNETAAMGFGFVTEILANENKNKFTYEINEISNRMVAYLPKINNKQNNNEMENLEQIKTELVEQKTILQKIVDFFTPKTKNLLIATEEGNEIELAEDAPAVGGSVISETPDGTYTIEYDDKKWKITIEGKTITALEEIVEEEPESEEMKSLKAENEALKKEIEELKAVKNEFETIKSKINELEKIRTSAQNFKKSQEEKPTYSSYAEELRDKRNKKQ